MIQKTDMCGVRSIAYTFLMLEPQETEYSPMIVKHPFTDSGIVPTMKNDSNGFGVANIMEDKQAFDDWQKQMKKQIDKTESPQSMLIMLTKSYYLPFLKYAQNYFSQEDFSKFLSDAWIMCEAPNGDPNFTQKQLIALFKKADPKHLMTEDDYMAFQELDDRLTIYRGVTSHNANRVKALSWTTNREIAEWFAHRFNEDGVVYEAEIEKEHIFAYFNSRNESEVIVNPAYLENISESQDMSDGFDMTM